MRKILLFMMAAISLTVAAKDADQIRIYINPGHGAWDNTSRPMKVIREENGEIKIIDPKAGENYPDTTAFYETNTNLRKCLAIVDKLESYGLNIDRTKNQTNSNKYRVGAALDLTNNICMSHVKAGPYPHNDASSNVCNRDFSVINQEVNQNDFDMFISVHSNAISSDAEEVNYPLILYRGYDNEDLVPGSKLMAQKAWPYILGIKAHPQTRTTTYIKGDISFYGSSNNNYGSLGYLGVLKHNCPGFLSEGYFHSYQPSRARMMNFDACRMEGYQYARGIADYFGLTKESTGDIWGIVRDRTRSLEHELYTYLNNTNDRYYPLNGVTVRLLLNGEEIACKTTDNQFNGSFIFPDLEPGTYTLELSRNGYKPSTQQMTVTSASISYPEVFLEPIEGGDRANFAYGLCHNVDQSSATFNIRFTSTGYCPKGTLELTPTTGSVSDAVIIDLGEVYAGSNSYVLSAYDLDFSKEYHWAVHLQSNRINTFKQVANPGRTYNSNAAGGVVIFDDPEDENFGTIVTAGGYASGIDIYSPEGSHKSGPYHVNASTMVSGNEASLFRGAYSNGKAVFSDWSDNGSGYWVFDPMNPYDLDNMLAGTRESGGRFIYDGTAIGGGCTGLSFRGSGSERELYVFCEDYPTTNANNLIKYSIGDYWTIGSAPVLINTLANSENSIHEMMLNGNVEVKATDYGIFLSQNRYTGNNSVTNPSFILVDYDGNLLFNSSTLIESLKGGGSGLALTSDGSRFAVSDYDSAIVVYDVEWDNNGKPTFRNATSFEATTAASSNRHQIQMQFDPSGNLLVFARGAGLKIYTVPDDLSGAVHSPAREAEAVYGRITKTPAPRVYKISPSIATSVETVGDEDTPVEYYNLQGQRVSNPKPGSVVIRRHGSHSEKIFVR